MLENLEEAVTYHSGKYHIYAKDTITCDWIFYVLKLPPVMLFRGFHLHVHALFDDTSENVSKIREASHAKLTISSDAIEMTIMSASASGTFLAIGSRW